MDRFLLDTNVCLRLANEQATQHTLVVTAAYTLLEQGHDLVTVPQTIYEFWAVATRPLSANGLGWSTARVGQEVGTLRERFTLLPDMPEVFDRWLELVTRYGVSGKQVHDPRLVAAMGAHGVEHVLTLNTADFERYTEVRALHPSEVRA